MFLPGSKSMKKMIVTLLALLTASTSLAIQSDGSDRGDAVDKHRIRGLFDVTPTPQTDPKDVGDPIVGRTSLDKKFHGDLEAVSKGQMLGVRTATKGSAGYVAIERVVGTLAGRKG